MNQKGSRQNPYWSNEFTDLYNQNRWTGGWVLSANGGSKDYYRSNAVPLHAYENGILGSLNKPFPGEVYNEMVSNGTWTGGWVEITKIDTMSAEYRTEDQISFSKENNDGIILGEHGNPVYLWMYDEMDANDIWFGGWVLYGDAAIEYIGENTNNNSGCGCGCGSGSGSGSGNGNGSGGISGHGDLSAGCEQKLYFVYDCCLRITIEWGNGTFNALDAPPSVSVTHATVTQQTEDTRRIDFIEASWCAAYLVELKIYMRNGRNNSEHFFEYYNIPNHYRS